MKKILITGAAGFIGSCLVAYLNQKNINDLILVDDLKCEDKWKNLVGKNFSDIISKEALFSYLEGTKNLCDIKAIIHLGACSNTMETDADYLLENNYRYSQKLATIAMNKGIRFIYASSAATYGDGKEGFSDNDIYNLRPINMYAFSKQLFDMWMDKMGYLKKAVALKYFNVFGPNEYHKKNMASMIFKMMAIADKGGSISLFKSNTPEYKDGDQVRDFIYVKDAVHLTALFLDELQDEVGIYNIGSGKTSTWNEVANALFDALGQAPRIDYIDMPKALDRQYQNYTLADMSKLKKVYPSYKPYSIKESVKDYALEYLLKNKRW